MSRGLPSAWPLLNEKIAFYEETDTVDRDVVDFYRKLFQVWYDSLDKIRLSSLWDHEEIKESLRRGKFLLSGKALPVDSSIYREILVQVSGLIEEDHGDNKLEAALDLPELQPDELEKLVNECALLDEAQMQRHVEEKGWSEKTGLSFELLAFLFFAALTPFYLSMAFAVSSKTDFSLWREGFCPLCGHKPHMAKLRQEDGARILECRLCHTQWKFSRLTCPFCSTDDYDKIHHFYTDEYPGRRVQLCENCKSYLKTTVIKEIGREVILELENIFTVELDLLARREGYHPGEDLAPLYNKH